MAESKESTNAKFIVTLLTIIAFAIGAVLWAVNSHAEIKEWASGQDFVTRTELKEIMKEQYVPRTDFIRVETKLEETTKTNQKILQSLEEVQEKLDSIKGRR